MTDDALTETWPDLPPLTDARAYEACKAYAQMLAGRGVTADVRSEHGGLLLKLRRACELYEKSVPPYARTLVVQDCDCGECKECRLREELGAARDKLSKVEAQLAGMRDMALIRGPDCVVSLQASIEDLEEALR